MNKGTIKYVKLDVDSSPEDVVNEYASQLGFEPKLLLLDYYFIQYWLPEKPAIKLSALYLLEKANKNTVIQFAVAPSSMSLHNVVDSNSADDAVTVFKKCCSNFQLPTFSSHQPLLLESVSIPKPWGQEIWYTGIEERGVAKVAVGDNVSLLPHVLSALPQRLCGGLAEKLILLKILDPLPAEVFGDLYFELHQKKREVYVVTAVDDQAWPDGKGAIRFGFDQEKRSKYASDRSFRLAFVESVKAYENIRRKIDKQIDSMRLRDGYQINEPVSADILSSWLEEVSPEISAKETLLRSDMYSFTNSLPLILGDVVKVPCLTPHSLQHGVRTVEFQTPVYERLILSFAQKVLTQDHWDIDRAAELMTLNEAGSSELEVIERSESMLVEKIVDFQDFEVYRIRLESGCSYTVPPFPKYSIAMAIDGVITIGQLMLAPEGAAILPAKLMDSQIRALDAVKTSFLLAYPK